MNVELQEVKDLLVEQNKAFTILKEQTEKQKSDSDPLIEEARKSAASAIAETEVLKQELIKQAEATKKIEAAFNRPGQPGVSKSFDVRKAIVTALKENRSIELLPEAMSDISKSLQTDKDPDGGYAVARDFTGRFIEQVKLTSPIRPYAFVGTTSSNQVTLLDRTARGAAARGSEGGTVSETDTPTLGEKNIFMKKYIAYPKATTESLEDPYFDLEAWLINETSQEIGILENYDFIWGNGISAPEGILGTTTKTAGSGVSDTYTKGTLYYRLSGTADDFSTDDMIKLYSSIKAPYKLRSNYYMNSNSLEHILLQKDGTSNYLLNPALNGTPNFTFFGKPLIMWEDLPDKDDASNKYPVLFGDMSTAYSIYDRAGVRIQRDPYTSPGFVKIYFERRTGGGITNYEAIKAIKSNDS